MAVPENAVAIGERLLSDNVVFDVLNSCITEHNLVQHQTHSYQELVTNLLPTILTESTEIVAQTANSIHVITYKHVHVDRPVAKTDGGFFDWIRPDECKVTRNTLAHPIVVDVTYQVFSNAKQSKEVLWETVPVEESDRQIQILERQRLGQDYSDLLPPPDPNAVPVVPGAPKRRIHYAQAAPGAPPYTLREENTYRQIVTFQLPSMVRSRPGDPVSLTPNARYDPGGYFIAKGCEKVVIPQKHLHVNKYFVFPAVKGSATWTGEIRACHSSKIRSTSTLRVNIRCQPGGLGPLKGTVQMPYIDMHIPVLAVCMLLGWRSCEEVATSVATGGLVSGLTAIPPGSLWDSHDVHTTRLWILSLLRDDAESHPDFEAMSRRRLLEWIGEMGTKRKSAPDRAKYVSHLMANEFLPQKGLDSHRKTIARKQHLFAFMLWRLAQVARGFQECDDRDHAGNKQYDLCGVMFALLLRQHYRNFRKRVASDIKRFAEAGRFVGIPELLSIKRMTDGFIYALSTGNWGLKKGGSTQTGVAQPLSRMNLIANVSHLRRLNTPLNRDGKQAKPRQLHTSLYGMECPAETPEGPPCGLVTQMAQCTMFCHGHAASKLIRQVSRILGASVFPLMQDPDLLTGATAVLPRRSSIVSNSFYVSSTAILEHSPAEVAAVHARQTASDAAMFREGPGVTRILVGGFLLGFVADGAGAAASLRTARRNGRLPFDVAVEHFKHQGLLTVSGEAGSPRRFLFVLDVNGRLDAVRAQWETYRHQAPNEFFRALLALGLVEALSKHEEEDPHHLVLPSPCGGYRTPEPLERYTHCELHPSCMLGVAAAVIPFSDHNQAPRTTYFASMSKQTAGTQGPDTPYTNALRLMYPQSPLVTTWAGVHYGLHAMPASQNVWVAVYPDHGLNQEDSLIVNGDSAARGMFTTYVIRNEITDCQNGFGADSQRFENPPPYAFGAKTANYSKLGPDGFVAPGTYIKPGDAYVGKTMRANEMGCYKRTTVCRDQSLIHDVREAPMAVDSVKRCRGREDKDIATVQMHEVRFLQEGDKLTSAHGQKGVVGQVKRAADMPYTADGIVADVLINPHAFPSRMTMGQQLEAGLGLSCAAMAEFGDGTPFRRGETGTEEVVDEVDRLLRLNGFQDMGHQVMYSGETGRQITARIFFGPTAYYRAKQMVQDKNRARARGPVHTLTQQPIEGGAKGGGLRIGEMERDCIQSHGAAFTCQDRLFYSSDYAEVPICRECHLLALPPAPEEKRDLVVGLNETSGYCLKCKRSGVVRMVPMPYIAKLLALELAAMHVRPEIIIDADPKVDAMSSAATSVRRNQLYAPKLPATTSVSVPMPIPLSRSRTAGKLKRSRVQFEDQYAPPEDPEEYPGVSEVTHVPEGFQFGGGPAKAARTSTAASTSAWDLPPPDLPM